MKVYLTKSFKFEAAHQLPNYFGKCANLHGHTYTLEVQVSGPEEELDKSGILVDFGAIKTLVNDVIVERYDHKYLNDYFTIPSAELMVIAFFHALVHALASETGEASSVRIECVRLNEGGGSNWAEVRRE